MQSSKVACIHIKLANGCILWHIHIYTVHTHVRHGLSTLSAANIINACIQSTHTPHIHTARTSCYIYCWYQTVCYTQCVGSVLTGSGSIFFLNPDLDLIPSCCWIRIQFESGSGSRSRPRCFMRKFYICWNSKYCSEAKFMNVQICWGFWAKSWDFFRRRLMYTMFTLQSTIQNHFQSTFSHVRGK
jgi:hypothetical protein